MESKISILMPTYNAEEFISEAIQSVLDQSYVNWELLIVNDGSTDQTLEAIASFSDERIRVFSQDNLGVSSARNLALEKSRGDFVCMLDSDDRLPQNSLSSRIEKFVNSAVWFVDGVVEKWSSDMNEKIVTWRPRHTGNPLSDLISLEGNSFFGPSWMIRIDKKRPAIKFDKGLTHGEDLLYYIEHAMDQEKEYTYTEQTVLNYRMHGSSAMSNLDGLAKGYKRIAERLKELDISPDLIHAFQTKSNSILFRCYLKKMHLLKAIRYL